MADFVKKMNEKYSEYEEERKRKHKQSIWRAIFTDLFYIKKRMLSLRHTVVQVKLILDDKEIFFIRQNFCEN